MFRMKFYISYLTKSSFYEGNFQPKKTKECDIALYYKISVNIFKRGRKDVIEFK